MMGQKSQTSLSRFMEASPQCDITLTCECKILLTISVCQVPGMGLCTWEITTKPSPIIITLTGEMLGHTKDKVGVVSHLYPVIYVFYGVKMAHKKLLITVK